MTQDTDSAGFLLQQWRARPVWMQPLMLFCIYMTLVYMPWDIFVKPVAEDQEVWFGYMFTGWAAKATAPFHWLVYGAGAWGFWHMKRYMWPWAALYCLQIAVGMVVWTLFYRSDAPVYAIVITGLVFVGLAWALHRSRPRFTG